MPTGHLAGLSSVFANDVFGGLRPKIVKFENNGPRSHRRSQKTGRSSRPSVKRARFALEKTTRGVRIARALVSLETRLREEAHGLIRPSQTADS
eukprot:scaffold11021_cov132-Isochrysis_galbana.AAC.4